MYGFKGPENDVTISKSLPSLWELSSGNDNTVETWMRGFTSWLWGPEGENSQTCSFPVDFLILVLANHPGPTQKAINTLVAQFTRLSLSKTQTTVFRPETAGVARQDLLIPGNERRGLGLKQDTDWVSQWNEGLWFLLGSELLSSEPHLRWTVLDLN